MKGQLDGERKEQEEKKFQTCVCVCVCGVREIDKRDSI